MHFTLQQLKLFESVSRNASYTRAAEELHLTQPAVSIQIKRLEEQVGLPLFELVGKKIFPTAAGKTMYQASRDILARVGELKNAVESLKGEVKGPLQLSVVTTSKYFMPHLLGTFLARYPEVEPKLVFTNRARVIQRLHNNEDDFVVMGQIPEDEQLETYPFLENILVPVAHPNHPLASQKNVPLEAIVGERFLVREVGSGTRLVFDRLLKNKGLKVEPYMELGSSEAIKQGVMAGLGLAILSLHSLRLEQAAHKLVVLDVEGFPVRRRWYAVHLKGKKLSLVARTFLDYILVESNSILGFDKG
ncbi:MAG: LysR substrate-binding domain-containing protein [Gammaproteobacteria bacterium]|nr:LysR substrate-binding domain-containing protein [Gammaproteobacteria bacterium]